MQTSKLVEKIYARPILRIGLHLLFWTILFVVKLYLIRVSFNVYRSFPTPTYILITLVNTIVLAACYYIAVYIILTILLLKRRYAIGIMLLLVLLICYTFLDTYLELLIISNCKPCAGILSQENAAYTAYLGRGLINVTLSRLLGLGTPIILLFTLCIPLSIKMAIQAFKNNIRALELAKDNLQLEFNFLKSQLNPHFLFNAMNNIYGLIISGDKENSAGLVSKLSELLRYTLYDSNEALMPIDRELKLMNDYIELESVRLNDTKVNFKWQLDHNDYLIAPLLLMPLIDNAFKYNRDEEGSNIDIFLEVLQGKFRFTIENNISDEQKPHDAGGIGINNLKKRLALYYKDKHVYEISISNAVYSVNLTIQL